MSKSNVPIPATSESHKSEGERHAPPSKGKRHARFGLNRRATKPKFRTGKSPSQTSQYSQRVVVKFRVTKGSGPKSSQRLRAHVRYLFRGHAGLDNEPPKGISFSGEIFDQGTTKFKDWETDPHHFRAIVSPQAGHELPLLEFAKELMSRAEKVLGRGLEWHAVAHFNTDNPHIHILIRGVDRDGKVLRLSREFISYGLRKEAEKLANERLGYRAERDVFREAEEQVRKTGPTLIDYWIKGRLTAGGHYFTKGPFHSSSETKRRLLIRERLQFLQGLELAKKTSSGYLVSQDFIRTLQAKERSLNLSAEMRLMEGDYVGRERIILDRRTPLKEKITGIVLNRVPLSELSDHFALIIAASDGNTYYVPLAEESEMPLAKIPQHGVVTIEAKRRASVTSTDNAIDRYMRLTGTQVYRRSDHQAWLAKGWHQNPSMPLRTYMNNVELRLATLLKRGVIEEVGEESFAVPAEGIAATLQAQDKASSQYLMEVTPRSFEPPSRLVTMRGATFLDEILSRQAISMESPKSVSLTRFQAELMIACQERVRFLRGLNIRLIEEEGRMKLSPEGLTALRALSRTEISAFVARDLRKSYRPEFPFCGQIGGVSIIGAKPYLVVTSGQAACLAPYTRRMRRLAAGDLIELDRRLYGNPKDSRTEHFSFRRLDRERSRERKEE